MALNKSRSNGRDRQAPPRKRAGILDTRIRNREGGDIAFFRLDAKDGCVTFGNATATTISGDIILHLDASDSEVGYVDFDAKDGPRFLGDDDAHADDGKWSLVARCASPYPIPALEAATDYNGPPFDAFISSGAVQDAIQEMVDDFKERESDPESRPVMVLHVRGWMVPEWAKRQRIYAPVLELIDTLPSLSDRSPEAEKILAGLDSTPAPVTGADVDDDIPL